MYGRGNYAAPPGQSPLTNTPPFHQHLPTPPPPPPISQGSHLPPPSMVPQGLPPITPQVGHLGSSVHLNASSGLPQQGPPNPVLSSAANDQPYLASALPLRSSQPLPLYKTSQMQQHSQWTTNASFIPPTVLHSAPRVLPPPPSQERALFGNQVHQLAAGSMQVPAPPHPQASIFYASPPVGSSEHLMPLSSNTSVGPLPPPPPLPSSLPGSPPLPPSSSPPSSSSPFSKDHVATPIPAASESAFDPNFSLGVSKSNGHEIAASGSDGGVSVTSLASNYVCDRNIGSNIVSARGKNSFSDLPPAPPKPADDRIVHRIELLCQFILRNGPEFENMTRMKEFENPEFKFLFGGEPGSEAAISHEYFIWTKRKCHLEYSSVVKFGNSNSPLRQSEEISSHEGTTIDGVPSSSADSDMDMEDDITHPLEEPQSFSSEKQSHETVSLSSGLDKEQELQPLLTMAEPGIFKDNVDENLTYSQHSESGSREQRQGAEMSADHDESILGKSFAKVDALDTHSSGDVGLPRTVSKTAAIQEGLSQPSTSAEPAEIRLENLPKPLVKQGAGPFRLLPNYASDESSGDEDRHVDVAPATFVPSGEVGSTSLHIEEGVELGTYCKTERGLGSDKELDWLAQSSKSHSSTKLGSVVVGAKDSITGESENLADNSYEKQKFLKDDVPQPIVLARGDVVGPVNNVVKKKDPKNMSSTLKVDEFGRLIREDDSSSDLGSPRYSRQKRGRSRSRSRSPQDRRRRRSPRRRNGRRGRSRSLSPKRRRSRSKSPPSRRGGDSTRRDKRQECFDFVKGKCYRGASCRYLHHDEKSDRSRSHRSRQQFQDSSRTFAVHERFEMPYKKLSSGIHQGRKQELKRVDDLPITEEKKGIKGVMDGATNHYLEKGVDLEPSVHLMANSNVENASGDTAHGRPSAVENLELQQSRSHFSDQFFPNAAHQHQQIDACPLPKSAHMDTPSSITNQLPTDETHLNDEAVSQSRTNSCSMNKTFESGNISAQSMVPKESVLPVTDHLSNPPVSQPRDPNLASSAVKFPSTGPVESFPPYQVSYAHSQISFPPNQSWNSLPPPPAQPHPPRPTFVNDAFLTPRPHGGSAVQSMLPLRNEFYSQTSVGPYLSEYPHPSNVGQNQGYPSLQEPNLAPGHLDDRQQRTSATSQPIMSQSHGGPGLAGEDRFTGRPVPGIYPQSSYGQESLLSQPTSFLEDSISKRHSFPSEILPPGGGISALHGEHLNQSSSVPRYSSDFDRNQPSTLSNLGISRISNHFNPYASTFDQPLSSKFSSNVLVQEKDTPYSSSTLGTASSQIHVEGRAVTSLGSLQPVEGVLPQPGGDQYDPLFDSIEPSLNSARKSHGQKHEITDESDDMLMFGGSNKPLDGPEKKQKVGGATETSGSLENDEFGETADAEVGAVENGSPNNLLDAADTGAGEVEIDQVNTSGKSKKIKESRSMKLFKVAIANFVKEVLKPSWRQGNMSKEAFKTIVKKTVDRVSGAMKSHQIPKSQAKINHYIDSSQRKLTKLVMGYVDKYVKV